MRIAAIVVAVSACVCAYAAEPQPLASGFGLAENQNFCADGVFRTPTTGTLPVKAWGSYCGPGDSNLGRAVSSTFTAPHWLSLYLAGDPSYAGLSLELERLRDGARISIKPRADPGTTWTKYVFAMPDDWRGAPVRLVAEDRATGWGGWLAFSEPIQSQAVVELPQTGILLWRTAWHFVLTMVSGFALCAFAAWKGVRDPVVLGGLGLVGIGLWGYLAFWGWFLSPHVGHRLSVGLTVAAAGVLVWFTLQLTREAWAALKRLLVPALLVLCASLMVLAAGFAYGGLTSPMSTPRTRFSHQLMGDNALPFIFADQLHAGHVSKPMNGDWHSSDRPPLQTGMVLEQYPFLSRPRDLGYTTLGAVLQSLWIFALWLLLAEFKVERRAIALAVAVPLFSGFVFLNTFFLWPKLFAAAFMLAFAALVLPRNAADRLRDRPLAAVLAGALLAFGLLTHGASVFALLGILAAALIVRIKIPLKRVAIILLACIVLYLPWMLYQKLFDPPGDRLLKWHLAGVMQVDPRPFLEVLTTSYAHLTFSQLVHNRKTSSAQVFDHMQEYWGRLAHLVPALLSGRAGHARVVELLLEERVLMFFNLFPVLGFLTLGPLALAAGLSARYRSLEWHAALRIWAYVLCVLVVYWLLMFRPESGAIHEGTYVAVLLASAGSTLALWSISRWLAAAAGALQVTLNFLAYGVYMREPGTPGVLTEGALQYGNLALFVAAVIGVLALLWRMAVAQRGECRQ
jgi:hypothetical protein